MLKELYDAIIATGREERARIVTVQNDPPHQIRWINKDGQMEVDWTNPRLPVAKVHSLDSIAAMVVNQWPRGGTGCDIQRWGIYVGESRVVYQPNSLEPRSYIYYDLNKSVEFATFSRIFGRGFESTFSCAELRRLFQYELRLTKPPDEMATLLEKVSRLEAKTTTSVSMETNRRQESMAKSILAKVEDHIELPSALNRFSVATFKNPDVAYRYPMDCMLEVDLDKMRWILLPFPGELEKAVLFAQNAIADNLRDLLKELAMGAEHADDGETVVPPNIPIFLGQPENVELVEYEE